MAPIEAKVALSHVEGVSDSARARELYKYYQPNAPVNTDTFFPAPVPSPAPTLTDILALPEQDETSKDINIRSNITSSKISSPDTALTAFCQLVTWRTGAQRAMISVIDGETQYFIAESTKTVDLVNNDKHAPGDDIWLGCTSVSKAGRLCERTLAVGPTKAGSGDYPSFIVNDLSKDERFNELPFVTDSPYLKFYAGVPLITKRGIPIGSLFIVDDRVWDGLSKDDIHFMGTMAGTIMKHMEMVREVEEHRRGMKMSRGLASFVEGRAELVEAEVDAEDGEGTKIAGQFEDTGIGRSKSKGSTRGSVVSIGGSVSSVERKEREYSAALSKTEEDLLASQSQSEAQTSRPDLGSVSQPDSFGGTSMSLSSPQEHPDKTILSPSDNLSETSSMKVLFSRAANLIREAFEVDGGAVFYDAQRGFSSDGNRKSEMTFDLRSQDSQQESQTSGDDLQSSGDSYSDPPEGSPKGERTTQRSPQVPERDSPGLAEGRFTRSSTDSAKTVEILGFSTSDACSIHGDALPGPQAFKPFDEKALHTLLRRYPRGKLWTFDSDGAVSSSSEEETFKHRSKDPIQLRKDLQRSRARSARNISDARFLSRHFPGVRQLLFVPLWDAGRSRWLSGCFAWSTEPTRILSKQSELAFLTAFGNSVMAECSRIDTEIADQKKGDFIGSISHELRSPLHGILASAEFLNDEDLSGFEKGLVETIDSCGRTLLDTINHILDFSKINHFEKNWKKKKRGGSRHITRRTGGDLALQQSELPMINLFADVDVSVVCEEVVEGVFAGHVFQNITAQSFDMVPDARGKMSDSRKGSSFEHMMGPENLQHTEVNVILDVDVQNYHFTTQPGAVRRVIMNLLGNALKYTSHGYVRIKLETTELEDLEQPGTSEAIARAMVALTVTDTGRGISSEFLRSKLFTPFAQENSLSSGTGLGLSIVRSIVNLLEGEITVDSEVGRGTQVRVTLPLLREMPKHPDSSSSTPKSVSSLPRDADESISNLRTKVVGQKCSLHGFDVETKDPILQQMSQLLKASITNFLTNWYGLKIVPLGSKGTSIIIANEANPITISRLAQLTGSQRNPPTILGLCSQSSRFDRSRSNTDAGKCNVGFVAKPVGPLKLARALMQCLDGAPITTTTPGVDYASPQKEDSNDLSNVFEELSLSPRGGEVLDNSRMAADSDNARKAIESPTPNALLEKHAEFPFPAPVDDAPVAARSQSMPADKEALKSMSSTTEKVQSTKRASLILAGMESSSITAHEPSSSSGADPALTALSISQKPELKTPRLLLVDDNKINLTLLRTYMRKRKYDVVDEAENGFEAVKKVQDREEGYDIIFMDISMPVLDGFGATRQIRAIEEGRRKKVLEKEKNLAEEAGADGSGESAKTRTPALVIALTGLASSRDQSEAFTSGIDLFLTKPVAFKEVGKMLDNWEANREREDRGSVGTSSTAANTSKEESSQG